ncbi:hypothetical protein L204_105269 [Cryptococcus depauperatus]
MPSDYSRMGKMVAKKELDRSATGWVVTSVAASFPFAASESSDLWSIWDLWAHVNPPREVRCIGGLFFSGLTPRLGSVTLLLYSGLSYFFTVVPPISEQFGIGKRNSALNCSPLSTAPLLPLQRWPDLDSSIDKPPQEW